jgi:hypothetical protein
MSCSTVARWLALAAMSVVLVVGLSACSSSGSSDPQDFAAFAAKVAKAAQDGDVEFFADRVAGVPHTCTADEVAESTGPNAPKNPICVEEGFEFDQVYIVNYGAPANATTEDDLINDLQLYFDQAIPQQDDAYGPGAVRLYATARPDEPPADGPEVHTAILTALHNRNSLVGRTVRGIDFELVDGRWVIPGETAASFPTAVDLLEPSSAVILYQDWAKYE